MLLVGPEDALGPGRFAVRGVRARHLVDVLEVTPGREIVVGHLDGPVGWGRVLAVDPDRVVVEVHLDVDPPPRPRARLVLAVPRPKVLRRLLPQLAALGLDELVLLRSWRVERSYLESEILRPEHWRPLLHEGLMQACLTHEPRVRVEPRFRPYVEDRLAAEAPTTLRVVAHPRAPRAIADVDVSSAEARILVVGPEAGFLDEEITSLERAGCQAVRLGPSILKVETACVVGLAQLALLAALVTPAPGAAEG